MGLTLAALQAGFPSTAWVLAIDGYPHLLSDAPQASVQTAWASTDWATKTVIPGLVVELDNSQTLHPWEPFQGGGKLIFKVQPDSDDRFGIDIHRSDDGAESLLKVTAGRSDLGITVDSTDAFPTSGEAHVGTECFAYASTGAGTFYTYEGLIILGGGGSITSTRGKYTAFGTHAGNSFAEHHRVTTADNGVRIRPTVSEQPRSWKGRRVSAWLHTNTNGVLNTKEEALCVFVGELSEAKDDSETGHTHIFVENVLDSIKDTTLGRDFCEMTFETGHYISAGRTFGFRDYNGVTYRTANALTVVASNATGTNQINAGCYSAEEFAGVINAWLLGEVAAARIHGNYTLACPEDVNGTPRTVMHFFIPSAANTSVQWKITWPYTGWAKIFSSVAGPYWVVWDTGAAAHAVVAAGSPQLSSVPFSQESGFSVQARIGSTIGTFQDNYPTLPAAVKQLLPANGGGYQWGVFMIETEEPMLIVGRIEDDWIKGVFAVKSPIAPSGLAGYGDLLAIEIGVDPVRIRQIFVHEGSVKDVMKWIFYSTGSRFYNHPTHDVLGYGQGLGLPYDILGANFDNTLAVLPRADDTILVVIEKPKKLSELFSGDLCLRRSHLIWREGGLRWCHWSTPSVATATVTLDEGTKAEPAENAVNANHRTASLLDSSWVKNLVKLQYDRDITKIGEGGAATYRSPPLVLEDATSVDDQAGKATTFTINCDNVYSEYDGSGQGIRELAAGFLAWMPFFSRPIWKITRSIDIRYYDGFGVGEIVLVTDPFVRDPTTGQRGITARPGLVVRHRYVPGGPVAGKPHEKPMSMQGEVDIVFLGNDRTYAYVPCAEIDHTKNDGGYTAGWDGSQGIFVKEHEHSTATEVRDWSRFAVADRIKVIEIDPTDPAAAQSWDVAIEDLSVTNAMTVSDPLTGFNTAKRYRLVFDSYADTLTSQRSKSFQAGSNGVISISGTTYVQPMQYGIQSQTFLSTISGLTTYDHTYIPELPANISYGPNTGAGRDTGYDKEIGLLINNLVDHKTSRSSPFLDTEINSNTTYAGYSLLRLRPIFLNYMLLGGGINRYLYLRPWWRSQGSGGATVDVSLRVSLSGYPPVGASRDAVTIKAPAVSNTWTIQSTSTNWHAGEEMAFPLVNFNYHQFVWLIVEGTQWANTRGLAEVIERERVPG